MEAILHFLGLCPDSFSHFDFMDIVICYYNELQSIINFIRIKLGS
jgi:hypothetical protein